MRIPVFTGTKPNPTDSPATFSSRADQTLQYLDQNLRRLNAAAIAAENVELDRAALGNFLGNWADQAGTVNVPTSVYHNGQLWRLASTITVTTYEPGVYDGSNYWLPITTNQAAKVELSRSGGNAATHDFTLPPGFRCYEFVLTNIRVSATAQRLALRTSSDGGSTFDSGGSDYNFVNYDFDDANAASQGADNAHSEIRLNNAEFINAVTADRPGSAIVRLHQPQKAERTTLTWQGNFEDASGNTTVFFGAGQRVENAKVDAVRFLMSIGILTATIRLYGYL